MKSSRSNWVRAAQFEILASNYVEVSQSIYYQVKVDQKIVIPIVMMCTGHDRGQLKFKTLLAKEGDLVGIYEQKYPDEILAIHDFKSKRRGQECLVTTVRATTSMLEKDSLKSYKLNIPI